MNDRPPVPSAVARLARNVGALTLARGLTMGMTLVTTSVVARALGPSGLGALGYGLALMNSFAVAATLGLDVLATREVARQPERVAEIVSEMLPLRLVLAATALMVYLAVVAALPHDATFRTVLAVQGLTLLAQAASLEWVYQGVERMGVVASRNIAAGFTQLVATVALVRGPDDVVWAAAAQTGAVALVGAGMLAAYRRDYGPIRWHTAWARWRALVVEAAPLAASVALIAVYYQSNKLLLGAWRPVADVGLYEAAFRVAMLAMVPGQVLSQAFFPSLSAAFSDLTQRGRVAEGYARVMLGVVLPVALGGGLLAAPLLSWIAGPAYATATPVLAVLMASVALTGMNLSYGQPLLAWGQQSQYLRVVGVGAVASVGLNIWLIPRHGPLGAAAALLGAEAVVLVGIAWAHRQATGGLYLRTLLRSLTVAGVGLGGGVTIARWAGGSAAVQIAAGVAGFVGTALVGGLVGRVDLERLRRRETPEPGRPSEL